MLAHTRGAIYTHTRYQYLLTCCDPSYILDGGTVTFSCAQELTWVGRHHNSANTYSHSNYRNMLLHHGGKPELHSSCLHRKVHSLCTKPKAVFLRYILVTTSTDDVAICLTRRACTHTHRYRLLATTTLYMIYRMNLMGHQFTTSDVYSGGCLLPRVTHVATNPFLLPPPMPPTLWYGVGYSLQNLLGGRYSYFLPA